MKRTLALGLLVTLSINCGGNEDEPFIPFCGDFAVNEEAGEECDDGNNIDGDGCTAECKLAACDDGIEEPGEVCLVGQESISLGSAGLSPRGIAVADLNGDEVLDIAMALPEAETVGVLLGIGGGQFQPLQQTQVGDAAQDLKLADMDGDGDLDVVVAGKTFVGILLNAGGGNLLAVDIFPNVFGSAVVRSLAVGDLDGDDDIDVAVANNNGVDFSVLKNDGAGNLGAAVRSVSDLGGPQFIAIADMNADGAQDIVVTTDDNFVVTFVPNINGDFIRFQGINFDFEELRDLTIGDADGTGTPDGITVEPTANQVTFTKNVGSGAFNVGVRLDVRGRPVAVVADDFNFDGRLDMVSVNEETREVSAFFASDGLVRFPDSVEFGLGVTPTDIAAGDFDGDGLLDVAITTDDGSADRADSVEILFQRL